MRKQARTHQRRLLSHLEALKTTGPRARDPGAFKSVLVRTNFEGWRALKMLAVEKDTTLNALAVEAFNDLLKKYGKRQSVENPLLTRCSLLSS